MFDDTPNNFNGRFFDFNYKIKDIKLNGNTLILFNKSTKEDNEISDYPIKIGKEIKITLSDKGLKKLTNYLEWRLS